MERRQYDIHAVNNNNQVCFPLLASRHNLRKLPFGFRVPSIQHKTSRHENESVDPGCFVRLYFWRLNNIFNLERTSGSLKFIFSYYGATIPKTCLRTVYETNCNFCTAKSELFLQQINRACFTFQPYLQ